MATEIRANGTERERLSTVWRLLSNAAWPYTTHGFLIFAISLVAHANNPRLFRKRKSKAPMGTPDCNSAEMDALDRAILRFLQRNNKLPHSEIARSVGLSTATVQRRIARMEEHAIISGNVAIVDPIAIGQNLTAIINVHLRDQLPETVDAAKRTFRDAPEIQQCYRLTGHSHFILLVTTSNMQSYESIVRRLLSDNPLIGRFDTEIALDRVKAETTLQLD